MAGPLERLVKREVAKVETHQLRTDAPADVLHRAYADAAEAREELNRHMGRLQRRKEEDGIRAAQAAAGDKHRFERETDPILRPDGQC